MATFTAGQLSWLREHGVDHGYSLSSAAPQNFSIEPPVRLMTFKLSGNIEIGSFTYFVTGRARDLTIGRYCSIARDALIGLGPHPTDWLSSHPFQFRNNFRFKVGDHFLDSDHYKNHQVVRQEKKSATRARVKIGHDVWIANGAMIMPGITIGTGAIIAARAVVTKDVPPYAIVGGNPARHIRYRFPEDTIQRLLALEWWRFAPWAMRNLQFHDVPSVLSMLEDLVAAEKIVPYFPNVITQRDLPSI